VTDAPNSESLCSTGSPADANAQLRMVTIDGVTLGRRPVLDLLGAAKCTRRGRKARHDCLAGVPDFPATTHDHHGHDISQTLSI
jgi:hypothetical protein